MPQPNVTAPHLDSTDSSRPLCANSGHSGSVDERLKFARAPLYGGLDPVSRIARTGTDPDGPHHFARLTGGICRSTKASSRCHGYGSSCAAPTSRHVLIATAMCAIELR
jgi:hypothetical protein